jgi:hypothetical protein
MTGHAEREAAWDLATRRPRQHRVTIGADKAYDARTFVKALRALEVTPHIAQHTTQTSVLDGRATRHPGCAVSPPARNRVEEIFGWLKKVGVMRQTRHRGRPRVDWIFTFVTTVYIRSASARSWRLACESSIGAPESGRGNPRNVADRGNKRFMISVLW